MILSSALKGVKQEGFILDISWTQRLIFALISFPESVIIQLPAHLVDKEVFRP
jgi:hypothetical protein